MTPRQRRIVEALDRVSTGFAQQTSRFIEDMARAARDRPDYQMTIRQVGFMLRIAHRYRRQIPTAVIEACLDEAEDLAERPIPMAPPLVTKSAGQLGLFDPLQ